MKKQFSKKEPELRATGRGSTRGDSKTQKFIEAEVARDRSRSRVSRQLKTKRSFNQKDFKVDKDEIKKWYNDIRSDKTGMTHVFHLNITFNKLFKLQNYKLSIFLVYHSVQLF